MKNLIRHLSVRWKLQMISIVASISALVLAGLALIGFDLLSARDTMLQELVVLAKVVGDRSTAALIYEDETTATENLAALAARSSITSACIYNGRDEVFATYGRDPEVHKGDFPTMPPAPGARFDFESLRVSKAILLHGKAIGTIYVESDLQEIYVRAGHYVFVVMVVALVAVAVALYVSSKLQHTISRPIRQLVVTARAISEEKDYSVRAVKHGNDELGELVGAFNEMVSTIEKQNSKLVGAKEHLEALVVDLESKNRDLEQFNYSFSHDLKTPLVSIQGFLGWLEQDVREGKTDRMFEDIRRIRDAASQMNLLLNGLRELSRISDTALELQELSFGELAQTALSTLERPPSLEALEVSIAPNLPPVRGARTQLVLLLQQLLSNSFKFVAERDNPVVEIGARNSGGEIVYFVHDNGIGIDPDHHESIFELFQKLDQGKEGTGVGLTIAKRVVKSHGGRIWVESDGPGQGADFCFTLPKDRGLGTEI